MCAKVLLFRGLSVGLQHYLIIKAAGGTAQHLHLSLGRSDRNQHNSYKNGCDLEVGSQPFIMFASVLVLKVKTCACRILLLQIGQDILYQLFLKPCYPRQLYLFA